MPNALFQRQSLKTVSSQLQNFKPTSVVTHLPPTSEISGSNLGPYVGKLVFSAHKPTCHDMPRTVLKAA